MTVSALLAILVRALAVSPVRLLLLATIVAGVATPIGLTALMLVTTDRRLMGDRIVRGPLRVAGWAVVTVVAFFSLVSLYLQGHRQDRLSRSVLSAVRPREPAHGRHPGGRRCRRRPPGPPR